MRTYLPYLLSSLLLLSAPSAAYGREECPEAEEHEERVEAAVSRLPRYSFRIETGRGYVSGVLLANDTPDETRGSMVNEFGVSALDFVYEKRKEKLKLVNVVGFLDKWYVRMVLKNDLRYCLHELYGTPYRQKHKYEVVRDEDAITVINNKRKLRYTFTPISDPEITDDTEE